jgi:hypothetical protein
MPANVNELLIVRVFEVVPPATLKPAAFDVKASPFTVVAVAAPKVGVVNVGEVVRASTEPEPEVEYDAPHADPVLFGIPLPG